MDSFTGILRAKRRCRSRDVPFVAGDRQRKRFNDLFRALTHRIRYEQIVCGGNNETRCDGRRRRSGDCRNSISIIALKVERIIFMRLRHRGALHEKTSESENVEEEERRGNGRRL